VEYIGFITNPKSPAADSLSLINDRNDMCNSIIAHTLENYGVCHALMLKMYFYEDKTFKYIAECFSLNEATIAVRCRILMRRLKEWIEPSWQFSA